jgi:phosphoribosyl 1,2-cyclic phosphodiesterase
LAENSKKMGDDFHLAVCSLASGSKGNAIYVSDGTTSILIDAGLSGVEIERRLAYRGISPDDLTGIIVSHEHIDHVRGVGVLSRRYDLPVYMNTKTQLAASPIIKNIKVQKPFTCGSGFTINGLTFHPFAVSHDADDPVGFTVTCRNTKIGLATDLGIATEMVKHHLKNCELLLLEANHDMTMLLKGPYPWSVKQRIKSRTGHLSNEESKILLQELSHHNLKHVILGHLSETNNTPEKALAHVGSALSGCKARLNVAVQDKCGEMIHLQV